MTDAFKSTDQCACGHHMRYHFDDGQGYVRCRADGDCNCGWRISRGEALSPEAVEGMIAFHRRMHERVECAHCHDTVALVDAFKCTDCERPYHKHCLGQHCAGEIERLRTAIDQVQQARLTWAMVCQCTCKSCDEFYEFVRDTLPDDSSDDVSATTTEK